MYLHCIYYLFSRNDLKMYTLFEILRKTVVK